MGWHFVIFDGFQENKTLIELQLQLMEPLTQESSALRRQQHEIANHLLATSRPTDDRLIFGLARNSLGNNNNKSELTNCEYSFQQPQIVLTLSDYFCVLCLKIPSSRTQLAVEIWGAFMHTRYCRASLQKHLLESYAIFMQSDSFQAACSLMTNQTPGLSAAVSPRSLLVWQFQGRRKAGTRLKSSTPPPGLNRFAVCRFNNKHPGRNGTSNYHPPSRANLHETRPGVSGTAE